jgi:tRNA(adenine34) deaminase
MPKLMLIEENFLKLALAQAKKAFDENEVPVGAVLVSEAGKIIKAYNRVEAKQNPLLHAEYLVITKALRGEKSKYLDNHSLFVTLEPCLMCASLIEKVRLKKLYFSAIDAKGGAIYSNEGLAKKLPHTQIYSGFFEEESKALLKRFFKSKR